MGTLEWCLWHLIFHSVWSLNVLLCDEVSAKINRFNLTFTKTLFVFTTKEYENMETDGNNIENQYYTFCVLCCLLIPLTKWELYRKNIKSGTCYYTTYYVDGRCLFRNKTNCVLLSCFCVIMLQQREFLYNNPNMYYILNMNMFILTGMQMLPS